MLLRIFFLLSLSTAALAEEKEPTFSFTYNALETVGFTVGSLLIQNREVLYLPFHFDAEIKFNDWANLSLGLVYRYEDYGHYGETHYSFGDIKPSVIWTNYHEVFLLGGPQFSFTRSGLRGFYASIRGGMGMAISPKYWNISLLAQPELGYTFFFNTPGLTLKLGLGVLLNLPVYESLSFAVPWDKKALGFSPLGVIVHQAVPILNLGLGFNL